jgi:hypothetical protein
VGTNAWSMAREAKVKSLVEKGVDEAEAKALASGRYTFYQVRPPAAAAACDVHHLLLKTLSVSLLTLVRCACR